MKFILILLICLISTVFALEVSPSEINFKGISGEVVCKSITVAGFDNEDVIIENRWANEEYDGRDFSRYKLDGNYLGLEVSYEKNIVNDKMISEVCVRGGKGGIYHGVLLFRETGKNSGVGVWVVVDLVESDVILLREMPTNSKKGFKGDKIFLFVLIFILIMLVGILASISVNFKRGD